MKKLYRLFLKVKQVNGEYENMKIPHLLIIQTKKIPVRNELNNEIILSVILVGIGQKTENLIDFLSNS